MKNSYHTYWRLSRQVTMQASVNDKHYAEPNEDDRGGRLSQVATASRPQVHDSCRSPGFFDHPAGRSFSRYRGGLPRHLLKRVFNHIDAYLATDISLTQLATVAGMSTHYFAELFRQSTGHPPYRYVLLRKIERAKQSLRYARCSVVEAALEAGFQNPSHFARTFRRFVGVSPSQFQSQGY